MLNLDYHSIKNEAHYFLDKNRKNMIYTATIIAIMTSLPALFDRLNKLMDNMKDYDFELLFINDGSKDKTTTNTTAGKNSHRPTRK